MAEWRSYQRTEVRSRKITAFQLESGDFLCPSAAGPSRSQVINKISRVLPKVISGSFTKVLPTHVIATTILVQFIPGIIATFVMVTPHGHRHCARGHDHIPYLSTGFRDSKRFPRFRPKQIERRLQLGRRRLFAVLGSRPVDVRQGGASQLLGAAIAGSYR